jgi:hypothetical protein
MRLVVEMARAALLAEGADLPQAPTSESHPVEDDRARKARNQRERRERLRAVAVTANVTSAGDVSPALSPVKPVTVTGLVTGDAPPDPPRETLSSPDLSDLSEKSERESQTRVRTVTARVTGPVTANVTGDMKPGPRAVRRTDPLPDELREMASGATGAPPVQDIQACWLKFTGHWDGRVPPSLSGEWQKWCVNEAGRESRDRAHRGPARVQPAPATGRAWKVGEEA